MRWSLIAVEMLVAAAIALLLAALTFALLGKWSIVKRAARAACVLSALAALAVASCVALLATGAMWSVLKSDLEEIEPGERARALGETISTAMNTGVAAFAAMLFAGALWLFAHRRVSPR